MLNLAGRFKPVRRKASLLLGAYAALDARMGPAFRRLGLEALPIGAPVTIPVVPSHLPRPLMRGG